jgi:hypothetical protein
MMIGKTYFLKLEFIAREFAFVALRGSSRRSLPEQQGSWLIPEKSAGLRYE